MPPPRRLHASTRTEDHEPARRFAGRQVRRYLQAVPAGRAPGSRAAAADAAPPIGGRPEHGRLRQRLSRFAARVRRPGPGGKRRPGSRRNIVFQPGINEDPPPPRCGHAAARRRARTPRSTGVFALWYGKGPASTAPRSAEARQLHRQPSEGRRARAARRRPSRQVVHHRASQRTGDGGAPHAVVYPANVSEVVKFGLLGWALSRYAGTWTASSASTNRSSRPPPSRARRISRSSRRPTATCRPRGLHYRGVYARPATRSSTSAGVSHWCSSGARTASTANSGVDARSSASSPPARPTAT